MTDAREHSLNGDTVVTQALDGTHITDRARGSSVILDDFEMWAFIGWFTARRCSVCDDEIKVGEVMCNDCFSKMELER